MQATEIDFSAPDHAVVDGHDAAAVHAPRHLVLVLAGGDAAVALDAALGIAQEFHSRHGCLLMPGFATWHSVVLVSCIMRDAVVAVGRGGVHRLAAHDRRRALRVVGQHVLALPPAGEVERHEARCPGPRPR